MRSHYTDRKALDTTYLERQIHLVKDLVVGLLLARALVTAQVAAPAAGVQEPLAMVFVILVPNGRLGSVACTLGRLFPASSAPAR